MNVSLQRLSSGLKISTAADNASGYVIAQYLQQQSNGYGVAMSNAQNGISVLQTAEGALNQSTSILQKMNQLAVQAANGGSQDTASSSAVQQQFQSLQNELSQISSTTQFGTTQLLNGSYQNQVFQVGAYNSSNDQINISINAMDATSLSVGIGQASVGTVTAAQNAITAVQNALASVATQQASLGASQNQLQAIVSNLTVGQQNLQAANSRIVNVNMAKETTLFTSQQILMQAGTAMLAQAQSAPQLVLKLIP